MCWRSVLGNSVAQLDDAGRVAYRAADDVLVDDRAVVGVVRAGDEAVTSPSVRGAFDSCPAPPISVLVGNSFSGDTLVVLADGTSLPIADVQVGDLVLAYDLEAGETVTRDVTATLPHTDWLLDAHLSDGTTMSVTEDHRFWSVTDNGWVELQDLDTTDQLLTPDGAMVTVDWLDWDTGEDASAWDLTVADEHNFFVAADSSALPVLVHNAGVGSLGCGESITAAAARGLSKLNEADLLTDEVALALQGISSNTTRTRLAELIGTVAEGDVATAQIIAENEVENLPLTRTILAVPEADLVGGTAEMFLSSSRFSDLASNPERAQNMVRALRRENLTSLKSEEVAEALMGSSSLPQLLEVASSSGGSRAIVRGAAFGFEQNGDEMFAAIVRNWTEPLPKRGISNFDSVAEEVSAARSFLEDELGPIESEDIVAMFESIDEAIVSGRNLNLAERNFLDHELLGAQLVAGGLDQSSAHSQVLETILIGSNFAPSLIVEVPIFSGTQKDFWGLQ